MSQERIYGTLWGALTMASALQGYYIHPVLYVFVPICLGANYLFGRISL